jgi:hypothetical protein
VGYYVVMVINLKRIELIWSVYSQRLRKLSGVLRHKGMSHVSQTPDVISSIAGHLRAQSAQASLLQDLTLFTYTKS